MKVLLFREHKRDPISYAISAITRGCHVHAALLKDEKSMEIVEAFWPDVHTRILAKEELAGIDKYRVIGLTPEMEAIIYANAMAMCGKKVRYSWVNLLRFFPFVRVFAGEGEYHPGDDIFCSETLMVLFAPVLPLLNAHPQAVCPEVLGYSTRLEMEAW